MRGQQTTNQLNNQSGGNIQLLGTVQRPRTVPMTATPITSKQLNTMHARGLVTTSQRNIGGNATIKMGTPMSGKF